MSHQRKWHILILSLLFSFLLWVSVNLGGRFQSFIEIKLAPVNIPKGKALVDPLPPTVNVKFNGLGWQLASIFFNPNIRYELDLSTLRNNKYISLRQNLSDMLKFPARAEAIDIVPDSLLINLDDYIEKKVPVKANIEIKCMNGYGVVGSFKTTPDSIIIGGASRVIKNINFWTTEFQKYEDVKNDIANIIPLSDTLKQVYKLSHNMVGVEINIQMLAEMMYPAIEVEISGTPAQTSINLIPAKFDLTVRSGVDLLAALDRSAIKAVINYKDILEDSTGYVIPKIMVPDGIRIIKTEPSRFEYVIRKVNR